MKKIFLALALVFFSSVARAGVYVSGGMGWNFHNDSKTEIGNIRYKYDSSSLLTAAVGYAFPVVPVRAEIEGVYNKSKMKDVTDVHMPTRAALVNLYVRVPVAGLYAGAGAGYASVRSKTSPVYQGMLGVEYGLFGLNLGLEYRHLQASKDMKKFQEESLMRLDAFMLKLRFEF